MARLDDIATTRQARTLALQGWLPPEPVLFLTSCALWQFQGRELPAETRRDVERVRYTLYFDPWRQAVVHALVGVLDRSRVD